MKETPSVAEIVFLLGEQWESRCLNAGMSELRVKAIILLPVAQHGEEIRRKSQAAALPRVSWAAAIRGCPIHLDTCKLCWPQQASQASTQGLSCTAEKGLCQEGAGRVLITSVLLAGAGGETRKMMLRHLP